MSEQEHVYVGGGLPVAELAELLSGVLDLPVAFADQAGRAQLLGPTPGVDGGTTELWVEPNEYATADDPSDATAGYGLEVSVRVHGPAEAQLGEARRMFQGLREARPDVPLLVTHEGVTALAAYLPGVGVHEFPPGTELDQEDADAWRPWVPGQGDAGTAEDG